MTRFLKLGLAKIVVGAFGVGVTIAEAAISGGSAFGLFLCVTSGLMAASGWGDAVSAFEHGSASS